MQFTPSKSSNAENDINANDIEQNNLFNNSPLKLYCSDISEINMQNENGWTPVYRSIIANNLNVLSELLKLGANPNLQNSIGETPLYLCVDIDNYEAINILLEKNADCNIPKKDGTTPLHLATKKNKEKFIKILLEHGANPNLTNKLYSQTPMHLAVKNKLGKEFLLLFKKNGADFFNIKDKYDKTPYDYANELYDENYFNMVKNIFESNDETNEIEIEIQKDSNVENFDNDVNNNDKDNKASNLNSLFKNIELNTYNNIGNDYIDININKDNLDIPESNNKIDDIKIEEDKKEIIINNDDTEKIEEDKKEIIISKDDTEKIEIKKDVETNKDVEIKKNIDNFISEQKDNNLMKENISNNINSEIKDKNNETEIQTNLIINKKEDKKQKIYKPKKSIKRKSINKTKNIKQTKINKNILKKELIKEDIPQKELLTAKSKENNLGLGITLTSSDNENFKSNTVKNMPSLINDPKLSTLSEKDLLKDIILDTAKKIKSHNMINTSSNISLDNNIINKGSSNLFSPVDTLKSEKQKDNSKEKFNKTFENGLSNNIKSSINTESQNKREMNTMNPLDMMNQIITTNSNISNDTQEQLNNKFNITNNNFINKDSDLLEYSKSYVTNNTHLNNTEENNLTSNNNGSNNINSNNNSSGKKNECYKKISYHCGKFLHKNNKGINLNNNFNEFENENVNEDEGNINNDDENINEDDSFENSGDNENINNENINSLKYKNLNINNKQYVHSTYDNSNYNSNLDNSNNNNGKQILYNFNTNSNTRNNNPSNDLMPLQTPAFNSISYKESNSRNKPIKINNNSGKKIANSISNTTYNSNTNNSSSKKYAKKLAILTELENSKNNSINNPMKTSISNLEDNDSMIKFGSGSNLIPNDLSSKLHDWLISCDLLFYYNILIKNKLYDINQYIEDIKTNKKIISYKSVEDLGIKKPGHIYRFILKIKLDSNMLDPYIYNSVIDKYSRTSLNDIKVSMSNSGYRIGCCCFRDSNLRLEKRSINSGLDFTENSNDIFAFLKKLDLLKFKENFVHNGFDQVEYIMIQLFSEYKFDKDILNEYLHIYSDEDKKKVIYKLYNEKRNLCQEYNIKYDENEDKDIYETYLKNYKDNDGGDGICSIF